MAWRYHISLAIYLLSLINGNPSDASTEYNRYLAHLFQKYGSGGTMPFEGLEHLMHNLGLGHIEFEPAHTIDEHRPKGYQMSFDEGQSINVNKNLFDLQTNVDDVIESDRHSKRGNIPSPETPGRKGQTESHATYARSLEESLAEERENGGGSILWEFKEMHDPKHRHPREKDATFGDSVHAPLDVCLSPKSLLRLVVDHDDLHRRKSYKTTTMYNAANGGHDFEAEYNEFINNIHLTPMAFMKLCPALLAQIDQEVCVQPAPLVYDAANDRDTMWKAWIYASSSIFILSACGLLGLLLVPLMKSVAYHEILNFLVAVAVGTLSGDALMHLLPHALSAEHQEDKQKLQKQQKPHEAGGHDNAAVWICACAFGTALFMYILENLLPYLKSQSGSENHGHSHSHSHSHNHSHGHNKKGSNVAAIASGTNVATQPKIQSERDLNEINTMLNELKEDQKKPSSKPLTPVAFMVIIGDGLHNLTDGLAIGAAFATDPVTGMATAFAVLCHELPHELGDFALLLQTGVSLKRTLCLNIVSSVLSFLGMAVGLFIAHIHTNMTQWIYAGTAGSFLYIAFADLIPAMAITGAGGVGQRGRKFRDVLIQILGILLGGAIMLVIAVNEEKLEVLFD